MFITENQKISESILFLLSAREVLSSTVKESKIEHKSDVLNFLTTEASDYEIMHLIMRSDLPDEKYNIAYEAMLFSELKKQVLINYTTLFETIGGSIETFINEVDMVSPELSSSSTILDFKLNSEGFKPEVMNVPIKLKQYANKIQSLILKAKEKANSGNDAVRSVYAQVKGSSTETKAITGLAIAALAIYGSVKLYKRYMSKAAAACRGRSGAAKTLCMKKFKHDAIDAQIKDLNKTLPLCAKTNNPEKCKQSIQSKIVKLQKKLQAVEITMTK